MMRETLCGCAVFAATTGIVTGVASGGNVIDLFVLAGQSNMTGGASLNGVPG